MEPFEQHYQNVRAGYMTQQADQTRQRLAQVKTSDLPAELARAEGAQNVHHEAEESDDIVRLLMPHMRNIGVQDVAIVREVMAFRKELLVERMAQLRAIIEQSAAELEQAAHLVERLNPYLALEESNT
jgi:hypothetical protein